ncbi:hypothetical protein K2224_27305 [Streptomyces sp. BHT-5-2]|uniref:hypothetical protein n=1 Tax=Streptomyces sp. BHT-5-2 TaxID=2866715 RepID=UPI001C8F12A2|nr:hypothetical protein [Streptomyces sp. BHT-5-2]QZL06420.1 hypothetical protein K2224_27305 [Streptomyces sp. BHT-5-2]
MRCANGGQGGEGRAGQSGTGSPDHIPGRGGHTGRFHNNYGRPGDGGTRPGPGALTLPDGTVLTVPAGIATGGTGGKGGACGNGGGGAEGWSSGWNANAGMDGTSGSNGGGGLMIIAW